MDKRIFEDFKELMVKAYKMSGSKDPSIKDRGVRLMARAFQIPLREGVFAGDIVTMVYSAVEYPEASLIEYPLDPIAPGTEKEFVAYTIPGEGDVPNAHAEGDYVAIPVYEVGFAISWLAKYARVARWDVLARFLETMEAAFIKKRNDDGWRLILAAAVDRNIIVQDSQAAVGSFTKRVISNAKVVFTRNGGGNVSSINRRFLTDIWLSPEMIEDMRNWGLDQVDEVTRREIYVSEDSGARLSRVFGVNLHPLHELGEGQEYQSYFLGDLAASLNSGDVELMIGVNAAASNSFLHPYTRLPELYPEPRLADIRKAGMKGDAEWGYAVLDNRDVIAISA